MVNLSKIASKMFHYQKYLGIFLIVMGIPVIIINKSSGNFGAEMPLMLGLFTLFFSTEKVEDERSVQIRTTSLYIAFVGAYTTKILVSMLYNYQFISFNLTEINHFIILVFAMAIITYYIRLNMLKS